MKFKIVSDHRALQWLHNFKDPDGLTARWLKKIAAFDYEVQHRPGRSIGDADGLSRILIINQVTTSQSKENLDEHEKTIFLKSFIKEVIFLNQKTHLHTAYRWISKCPRELPEVLNEISRITFQRAEILHFLFNN